MSRIRANTIVNGAGTGAPNFPKGAIISGISTITADINIGTGASISSPGTNELALGTNNLERLRITSTGKVLVGHTTNHEVRGINAILSLNGTGPDESTITLVRNNDSSNPSYVVLGKSRGSSEGATTIVEEDDIIGEIAFAAADGTDLASRAAQIRCRIDGTPGVNDTPGRLEFLTCSIGTNNPVERMTIDNAGTIVLPNSSPGIQFGTSGASGLTSKTLDDYEEGTWTPSPTAASGAVFNGTEWGRYTKIGRSVTLNCYARFSTLPTGDLTGIFTIEGVPFTPVDPGSGGYSGAVMLRYMNSDANSFNCVSYITDATNGIRLYQGRDSADWKSVDNEDWTTTNAAMYISISYDV